MSESVRSLQVLLVDDNPVQLNLVKHLFQHRGHKTLEAKNGAEALIMLATEHPHLVVSDCQMPLLDGYQLCRLLKDDKATRHLPVVLLTSQSGGLARFWAKTCGADRFLVSGRDLDQVVDVALSLVREAPELPAAVRPPQLNSENFGVDAIQRRLAQALEQRLLETTMRDAIARLYTAEHDTARLARGFIEILQELVLPGAVAVACYGDEGLVCHGVHGFGIQGEVRLRLQRALEEQLQVEEPIPSTWQMMLPMDDPQPDFKDPVQVILPAGVLGHPAFGVVGIWVEGHTFQEHERLFEIAAEELGRLLILESSRLRLYHQAIQDPLTGLYNRRHAVELLEIELAQCQRFGRPMSVMALDLDQFKSINDRFGHLVGDQVLSIAAQRLGFGLRKVDRMARMGGDEFLVFCPQTDLEGAASLAERLLEHVSRESIPGMPADSRLTLSIGVATWNGPSERLESLLARADRSLYQAKANGRNRVMLSQE